ncbi:hypothetical protein IMZ48_47235 [Candidatus Bathyarchaeota archaeon]|nr:hypothetical protein [Candidatus Bathyarchaeota archaeon]
MPRPPRSCKSTSPGPILRSTTNTAFTYSTGVISKAFPVTVNNGEMGIEFKAALQLKAEFGVTAGNGGKYKNDITFPNIGGVDIAGVETKDVSAGAIVGATVNLIEYVAKVSPEDDCALEAKHQLNVNMGVFAKVGVSFEDEFLSLHPSATRTLLTLPLPSSCLLKIGLPVPTRETPLPTAGECGAKETPSAKDNKDEEEKNDGTKIAAKKDDQDKGTTAPYPTVIFNTQEKRDEPKAKELTAVACGEALADCPDKHRQTVTYKTSFCDAPAKTGSCFAVTEANNPEPTSVVNTKAPVKANTAGGLTPKSTGEAKPEVSSPATGTPPKTTNEAKPEDAPNPDEKDSEKGSGSRLMGSTMALVAVVFAAVVLL